MKSWGNHGREDMKTIKSEDLNCIVKTGFLHVKTVKLKRNGTPLP